MASAPNQRIILIETEAPAKPALGAPCNGCGVCCLAEPCPLGIVLSGTRHGACRALRWQAENSAYRCGAMTAPNEVAREALPLGLKWLSPLTAWALRRLAGRWIAAGQGCDSTLEPALSSTIRKDPDTAAPEAKHPAPP